MSPPCLGTALSGGGGALPRGCVATRRSLCCELTVAVRDSARKASEWGTMDVLTQQASTRDHIKEKHRAGRLTSAAPGSKPKPKGGITKQVSRNHQKGRCRFGPMRNTSKAACDPVRILSSKFAWHMAPMVQPPLKVYRQNR